MDVRSGHSGQAVANSSRFLSNLIKFKDFSRIWVAIFNFAGRTRMKCLSFYFKSGWLVHAGGRLFILLAFSPGEGGNTDLNSVFAALVCKEDAVCKFLYHT